MTWRHIESSAISAIGYDAATERLQIRFTDGEVYEYRDVPGLAYAALIQADSKGRHLNLAIRGRYAHARVWDS